MSGINHLLDLAEEELAKEKPNLTIVKEILASLRPRSEAVVAVSIFGHKTREPLVELRLTDIAVTQWTPADARHHAMAVIEAAEAAESDAFFFEYITQRVGANDHSAAGLLGEFRAFRAAQRERG